MLGTMTVREVISMSARLRLPPQLSVEEKMQRVDQARVPRRPLQRARRPQRRVAREPAGAGRLATRPFYPLLFFLGAGSGGARLRGGCPSTRGARARERQRERQRDRETERQRDRETERQRDRETERERAHVDPPGRAGDPDPAPRELRGHGHGLPGRARGHFGRRAEAHGHRHRAHHEPIGPTAPPAVQRRAEVRRCGRGGGRSSSWTSPPRDWIPTRRTRSVRRSNR